MGLLAVANAVLGMALGLLVGAFAQTEFQAVQFMPAFILPQLKLCGLFVRRRWLWGPHASRIANRPGSAITFDAVIPRETKQQATRPQ